ncbi:hypothetical protein LCGC14_2916480, partial [marine sediment metagenome]
SFSLATSKEKAMSSTGIILTGGPWAARMGFRIFEIRGQNACPSARSERSNFNVHC